MKKNRKIEKSQKKQKINNIISKTLFIIVIILINILICSYYYLKNYLGDVSFFQFYYHVMTGSSDSGTFTVVFDAFKLCIPIIIVLIVVEIFLFTRWKKYKLFFKSKRTNKEYCIFPTFLSKYRLISSFIILIICILTFLNYLKFLEYLDTQNSKTDIYEKYYIDSNKVNISFNGKKRNLIHIYLESMESSLFSKNNNGCFEVSRIPELEKLAEKNINFSQNSGLGGMYDVDGYTISALVSSTSGTPIESSCKNDCEVIVKKVRTLGDVLKDEGYNIEYIQGSDATFAGFKNYLNDHSKQKVLDYYGAIEKGYIDSDYFTWWGYEDKKLFSIAKKEITELSKKDKPFAATLITMDTHFPDGYQDKDCKQEFNDDLSNSYLCSSKKVYQFIEWIKKQDFYDDTMIVITGDHKTMQNAYYKNIKDYERTVYNVFINSKKDNINSKNRIVTNFDMYPTVLSGLGADIKGNRIGFGTNLFSNQKTIAEIIGIEKLTIEKKKSSKYYNKYIN